MYKGLRIYLAGKMSELEYFEMTNWRNYTKAELEKYSEASNYNVDVVSPVDYFNFEEPKYQSEEEVMKFDLGLVHKSNIVIVNTNGLNTSIGSVIEIYEAWKSGIPIIAYDENGDYNKLHPWLKCYITRVESCVADLCGYIQYFYMR